MSPKENQISTAVEHGKDFEKLQSRKDLPPFGTRHTLAIMGFFGISLVYALRINLSVAIVAMVNQTKSSSYNQSTEACPNPDNYDPDDINSMSGEFDWDEQTQGLILGSYFYGYVLSNFIGGRAAEMYGTRLVVGIGIVLTSLFTMLSPIAAQMSWGVFIGIRILIGLSAGATYPGMTTIIANYYPQQERSKFISFIFLGGQFGTVVTLIISGILCDSEFLGGWPSAFYVFGAMGLVWGVFWFWLIRDDPSENPRISKAELSYIEKGIPGAGKARVAVPWKSIFTCSEFYTTVIMHFGYNWIYYTLLTQLPTYFDQILHFNIKTNGFMSSLPNMGSLLFGIVYTAIIDQMIVKEKITILNVRRLSMILAGHGSALMIILMCFVNCHSTIAIMILVMGGVLCGPEACGYVSSYIDIAPRFAGTLMGIGNTFTTIPGFVSPAVTGAITLDNQTLWAWRQVFIISALITWLTATFYVVKIDVKVKKWNSIPVAKNIKTDVTQTNEGFNAEEVTKF